MMAAHIVPFYLALPFLPNMPNPLPYPTLPYFAPLRAEMRFPALTGITSRSIGKQTIANRLYLRGCFNIVSGRR